VLGDRHRSGDRQPSGGGSLVADNVSTAGEGRSAVGADVGVVGGRLSYGDAPATVGVKPSDFPRDPRFRVPGAAFVEDGVAHVRSYRDVRRMMLDGAEEREFSRDSSFWSPPDTRIHATWSFIWGTGHRRANGCPGRYGVWREVLEPYFRNRAIDMLGAAVLAHTRALVAAIIDYDTGELNLAAELAYPLALRTNCSLLGIPDEHWGWLSDQLFTVIRAPRGGLSEREPEDVEAYLADLIAARRAHPGDALLDVLIAARDTGRLTDLELLGCVWSLTQSAVEDAGTNTTNTFALLGEYGLLSAARERAHDASWLHWANEEVLRFGSPFPARPAVAVTDLTLDGGVQIAAGTPVRLWISAANRDPEVNGGNPRACDPTVFDPTRAPNRHLSFGVGPRMCPAARLARLQAHIALREVLSALPRLELDPTQPFERHAGITDGVLQAHFRFDQHEALRCRPEA
jgi:cytochrome P450